MIAGLTLTNDRAADRVVGVRQAALQAGIGEGDLTVVESPYTLKMAASVSVDLAARDPAKRDHLWQ